MPTILRSDFKRLGESVQIIEKNMIALKIDRPASIKDTQDIDLERILRDAQKLEWDLNMTMADFVMACRQYWKEYNLPLEEGLRRSSVYMDCILDNLEKMKWAFENGEMYSSQFEELHQDWEAFKKCIYQAYRAANRHQERRKNFHWLNGSNGEGSCN